ncbi:MAG: peptidoglycan DD-metalloendopeptidase family protein [Lachnotalea sp.]
MMRKNFTGKFKNKVAVVGAIAFVAVSAAVVGTNLLSSDNTKDDSTNLVDLNELPDTAQATTSNEETKVDTVAEENIQANNYSPEEFGMDNVMDATDEVKEETDESALLDKVGVNDSVSEEDDTAIASNDTVATNDDAKKQTTVSTAAIQTPNFQAENKMVWPVSGNVLINYSMDSTVYFATLNQYKYNSALIIQGDVNTKVSAAADGVVEEIYTNEETGITMKVNLGNGYTAIYGQLKETLVKQGDVIAKGSAIGYISEPTKYYSVEGSNLYFKVMKDNSPVNPMNYLE